MERTKRRSLNSQEQGNQYAEKCYGNSVKGEKHIVKVCRIFKMQGKGIAPEIQHIKNQLANLQKSLDGMKGSSAQIQAAL